MREEEIRKKISLNTAAIDKLRHENTELRENLQRLKTNRGAKHLKTELAMTRDLLAVSLRTKGESFKQLGEELGVHPSRARQIYLRGIRRLRRGA